MSKLSCWFIEEAGEYVTPNNERGPAYVFLFEYRDVENNEQALAQFLSEKVLNSAGTQCFSVILHRIKEDAGFLNITQEDIIDAFGACKPFHQYGVSDAK